MTQHDENIYEEIGKLILEKLRQNADELYMKANPEAEHEFCRLSKNEDELSEAVKKHCIDVRNFYDNQIDFLYAQSIKDTIQILKRMGLLR